MQTRKRSALESFCNVSSGFIIAMLTWELVIEPVFDIEKNLLENLHISMIFTVVSLVRGYVWRRVFNRKESC